MTTPTGINTRQDHTPGSFRIEQSPFRTAEALARRLSANGVLWQIEHNRIGGMGNVTQAIERDSRQSVSLWRDARGGWWIQKEIRRGLLMPDIDATLELTQQARHDEPPACGNYLAEETAYYAHPD